MDGGRTHEPRWLDDEEMAAWLPMTELMYRLPQALDRQLREESGISHTYYQMLARLSAEPDHTTTMGRLAHLTTTSPSRLSHAVAALEKRGWVERRQCDSDRRIQFVRLTGAGFAELERIAPGHVAEVRRVLFDRLSRAQVAQLRAIGETLLEALDGE